MAQRDGDADSKELAVLQRAFSDLFKYLMGNGREGKLARIDREIKELKDKVEKDSERRYELTDKRLEKTDKRLEKIEERLGRVINIIAWACGAAGIGIGAVGKWFIIG